MSGMEIFVICVSLAIIFVGYYYSRKYSRVNSTVLMWVGTSSLIVGIWRSYNAHFLHLTGEAAKNNAYAIRAYGVIVLIILCKLALDYNNKKSK